MKPMDMLCSLLLVNVGASPRVARAAALAEADKVLADVSGGEDPRINGADLWYSAPFCGDDAAVLAAVQHASRRLRRCPAGMLDRHCARRAEGTQVGTTGWPS
jgi:hypothetical protein